MTEKVYHFDVPVSGRETFSVRASSYEEALEKIRNEEYEIPPETIEIEWDFGLSQKADHHLPNCYTLEKIGE